MATCQKCGGPIYANEKFCPHCGAPIAAPADAALPQSAQQSYGYTVPQPSNPGQPQYAQGSTYAANAQPYGQPQYVQQQYVQQPSAGVQAIVDPNTGAGIQIYTPQPQFPQQPYIQFVPSEPQPQKPKADPNSASGRAMAEAEPIDFALKTSKVGIPIFFGCNYDPLSYSSTMQAYDDLYRAMGVEAQIGSEMAAQVGAYKMAYNEMMSLVPKPEPPQPPQIPQIPQLPPQPVEPPQPQPQQQPQQPLVSIPAVAWPFGSPNSPFSQYTLTGQPAVQQQPALAPAPAEAAPEEEEPADEEYETPAEAAPEEVEVAPEEDLEALEAKRAAQKEEKRVERLKKREERKMIRKISAFD